MYTGSAWVTFGSFPRLQAQRSSAFFSTFSLLPALAFWHQLTQFLPQGRVLEFEAAESCKIASEDTSLCSDLYCDLEC